MSYFISYLIYAEKNGKTKLAYLKNVWTNIALDKN